MHAAEKEAKEEAKRCAEAYIRNWLADEAPRIVQGHVEFLADAIIGRRDDPGEIDEMGEKA